MFRLECIKLSEKHLTKVVSYENGQTATIRWGIWHIADHSRYHQAHISLLKNYIDTSKLLLTQIRLLRLFVLLNEGVYTNNYRLKNLNDFSWRDMFNPNNSVILFFQYHFFL